MKTKIRIISIALSCILLTTMMAGCRRTPGDGNGNNGTGNNNNAGNRTGTVYYLNFKPEQDKQWQELAAAYTEETGIEVTVLTAASGQYETTLRSEIAKTNAPTLFQVNGPVGLASWKDFCYDLSGSKLVDEVTSEEFLLKEGDKVLSVGYVIETYGLIYNKPLLEKAGYKGEDIRSFDDLKRVSEDITARKDELGFSAFTSAGMHSSSAWRFHTHLANLPIYYEYKSRGIAYTDAIEGTYLDNYKKIWDLYINNSTTSPSLLGTRTGDDAVAEFVTEQAVFYQNGTWAHDDIGEIGDENLGMLPIYIGAEGEEEQGLCTGTENFWCVNSQASEDNIQATLDFLEWVVTTETGINALNDEMGFVTPFKRNKPAENPLVNIAAEYVDEGKIPVAWYFTTMPSEAWKSNLGSALTAYAAGTGDWEGVRSEFVDGWAREVEKTTRAGTTRGTSAGSHNNYYKSSKPGSRNDTGTGTAKDNNAGGSSTGANTGKDAKADGSGKDASRSR